MRVIEDLNEALHGLMAEDDGLHVIGEHILDHRFRRDEAEAAFAVFDVPTVGVLVVGVAESAPASPGTSTATPITIAVAAATAARIDVMRVNRVFKILLSSASLPHGACLYKRFRPGNLLRRGRQGKREPPETGDSLPNEAMPTFIHTCYRIGDIDRSVAFYEKLGFEEVARMPIGDEAINVFMGLPGEDPRLELTYNHGVDSYEIGTGYNHIALGVEDLDGTLERLAARRHRAREAPLPPRRPHRGPPNLLRPRPGRVPH